MAIEENYKIVNFIKEYRKKLNITQGQLAEKLEVSPSFINKIENDRKVPSLTLAFLILVAIREIYMAETGLYLELRFEDLFEMVKLNH